MKRLLLLIALLPGIACAAQQNLNYTTTTKWGPEGKKAHENFTDLYTNKEPSVYVGETAPADTTRLFLDSNEEAGVLVQKKYVTGTGWVRVGSHGVQYATSCASINGGMCVDAAGKLYYHNGTAVVEVGSGGSVDLSAYLSKTNTTSFTPSADYHPATKKYVDDSITAGGGYTDEQAQDAAGGMFSGNTETGISVDYDDTTGKVNFVVSGAVLPTWMPSVGPTNGRQILQAVGGCSDITYDNQIGCETNSGTWTTPTGVWTSVISGLINDLGIGVDDLWSASKIIAELAYKQGALGFTPENTANKGTANGYAGLGGDGKVPANQLPETTGTDDQTAAEVTATPWGDYISTTSQALMQEIDATLRALIPATLAELSDDTAHRTVTDSEKSAWNAKQSTLTPDTDYLTPGTAASTYQADLSVPDQTEAEAGVATTERVWTSQRIAQAIAALAPGARVIASGTATMGTSTIASGTCATAVTVSGSGIVTTDRIDWGFNSDITSTTGYMPSTSGMLTLIAYPTAGSVNFLVCNNTAASITPGAVTLNWGVLR